MNIIDINMLLDQVKAGLKDVEKQMLDLHNAYMAKITENADLKTKLDIALDRIKELKKSNTEFGVDPSSLGETKTLSQVITDHKLAFNGPLPHVRIFSSGKPSLWTIPEVSVLVPEDKPCFSFKQWDLAAFNKFMDGIPKNYPEVWVCYYHEPEDDAKRSGNIAGFIKNYLSVYAEMDKARKAHPNGKKVKLVKIMMHYQQVMARTEGCTWREFHGGQMFVDALGWDCYNPTFGIWKNRYATAQELFDGPITMSKETGIPWCIPELGSIKLSNDIDGSMRAIAMKSWIDYLKGNDCLWANWWCSNGNVGKGINYHLDADNLALSVWSAAIKE